MATRFIKRIRRTPSQVILYVVSTVMWMLALVVLITGALIVLKQQSVPEGISVIAGSFLVGLTALWGTSAANNYQKIGRYRTLCYVVSLILLLILGYGWSNGHILLFNPIMMVLITIYVLICSSLADRVERDYAQGIQGELIVRGATQQTLHFLSSTLVFLGIVTLICAAVAEIYLYMPAMQNLDLTTPHSWFIQKLLALDAKQTVVLDIMLLGMRNAVVGFCGIIGANHPKKCLPALCLSLLTFAFELAKQISDGIFLQFLSANGASSLMGLLLFGSISYLTLRLYRQVKASPEDLCLHEAA